MTGAAANFSLRLHVQLPKSVLGEREWPISLRTCGPGRGEHARPAPRWQRRLSEFAIVSCCLIRGHHPHGPFTWIGAIRLLSHLLARSPDPTGTITALCLVALALSPFAMWFFYRQFASTQRALTQLAGIDTLTGLPNRLGLTERLESAIEATRGTAQGVAILFVDLDRFKVVNDTFGHELGDALDGPGRPSPARHRSPR